MSKIYYVDFQKQELIETEEVEQKEVRLDPVLERVKQKLPPDQFELYKKTIDHWMEENFMYEMEQVNLRGEEWHFHGRD